MKSPHSAQNCRWAQPAVFLPLPGWIGIWRSPWACLGDDASRVVLDEHSDCSICARWAERPGDEPEWILSQVAV